MKEDEIFEGNKLIAGYMEYTEQYDEHGIWQRARYNSSWDWLMPVVRKIFDFDDIDINKESSGWYAYYGLETSITIVDIEWSFLNCVNFIKWYNEKYNGSF